MKVLKPFSRVKSKVLLKQSYHNDEFPQYKLRDSVIMFTDDGLDLFFDIYDDVSIELCADKWIIFKKSNNYRNENDFIITDLIIIYNKKNIFIQVLFYYVEQMVNNALIDCFEATINMSYNPHIHNCVKKIKMKPRENNGYRFLFMEEQN